VPVVKTGPLRLGGYAIKLRRVVNAVLREKYKSGEINSKTVNKQLSDINAVIYNVIVEKYQIPKDAIINIVLDFDVVEGRIKVNSIEVELYEKIEIISRNASQEILKLITKEEVLPPSSP